MAANQLAKIVIQSFLLLAVTIYLTQQVWQMHEKPMIGIDDANIFFVYAENLVAGKGLTYGVNGERVEGFTSLLWMLVCAFSFGIGLNETGLWGISLILDWLTQVLFLWIIQNILWGMGFRRVWLYQAMFLLFIFYRPDWLTWMSLTLMDTCLWGFFLALLTWMVMDPPLSCVRQYLAVGVFFLLPMVRPEALLVGPVVLVVCWLYAGGDGEKRKQWVLWAGGAFLGSTLGLIMFRLWYFGYPLPNTWYAKVSPSWSYNLSEGFQYLSRYIFSSLVVGVGVVVAGASFATWLLSVMGEWFRKEMRIHPLPIAGLKIMWLSLLLMMVPVLTGGDHFLLFRQYQPLYPLLCLSVVLLLGELRFFSFNWRGEWSRWGQQNQVRMVCLVGLASLWLVLPGVLGLQPAPGVRWGGVSPLRQEFQLAEKNLELGKQIQQVFQEWEVLPVVGVTAAGAIARSYPGKIIDLMGLNEPRIAHFKGERRGMKNHAAFEKEVFYQLQPDILLAAPPNPPATANIYNLWLKGLLDEPQFYQAYRFGRIHSTQDPSVGVTAFHQKTLIEKVDMDPGLFFREEMVWDQTWVPVRGKDLGESTSLP